MTIASRTLIAVAVASASLLTAASAVSAGPVEECQKITDNEVGSNNSRSGRTRGCSTAMSRGRRMPAAAFGAKRGANRMDLDQFDGDRREIARSVLPDQVRFAAVLHAGVGP